MKMGIFDYKAVSVSINKTDIKVVLEDGRIGVLPLSRFKVLKKANEQQLSEVKIVNGYALYWPKLNEDLSIAGFFEK